MAVMSRKWLRHAAESSRLTSLKIACNHNIIDEKARWSQRASVRLLRTTLTKFSFHVTLA
jgi:hypothetical protein